MRVVLACFVLVVGCKSGAPSGEPDAGPTGLVGQWSGIQSTKPGGTGLAAEVDFAPNGGTVLGLLTLSDSADAKGLAPSGYFVGYANGGTVVFKRVNSFFSDGGPDESLPLTVTQTSPSHFDAVEQNVHILDGGPFPLYYRFDRK